MTNILRQRMRRVGLPLEDARRLLADFLDLSIALATSVQLYDRALQLADQYHLPAAYDAHYLALAQLIARDLWTDDQRLIRLLGSQLTFVKWIGDYNENDPL